MVDLSAFDGPLFSDGYRRTVISSDGVADAGAAYESTSAPTLRERIVRCVWFDQTLTTDKLRTDDGRKLRVVSPGWWNLEAGPDFRNASIRIAGGALVRGDVEVHIHTTGWRAHGHHKNPAYNGVVLHVVLWNDTGASSVETAAGESTPQLTLEPYLTAPLPDLVEDVDPAEYPEAGDASKGDCQSLLQSGAVTVEWLAHFLDHAGDHRIVQKARRLAQRRLEDDDPLLYEGIAACLGYKRNKAPLLDLARRLPLAALRSRVERYSVNSDRRLAVEALLFGMAGLLPDPADATDDAGAERIERLQALWTDLGGDFAEDAMDARQWSFDGTRPTNFPTRRIAALAALTADHLQSGLGAAILRAMGPPVGGAPSPREASRRRADLLEVFLSLHDPFWDFRYRLDAPAMSRGSRLIGGDRAKTIVIDAILPALLYRARRDTDRPLEELLRGFYARFPALPSSSITRFMALRLFGRPERELKTLRSARRQQGLYQVYVDFCDSETATCGACPLLKLLKP
ncbi:DUF2851 family protein [bacterium]|nr:DUF2851 family protein [bacterium]